MNKFIYVNYPISLFIYFVLMFTIQMLSTLLIAASSYIFYIIFLFHFIDF